MTGVGWLPVVVRSFEGYTISHVYVTLLILPVYCPVLDYEMGTDAVCVTGRCAWRSLCHQTLPQVFGLPFARSRSDCRVALVSLFVLWRCCLLWQEHLWAWPSSEWWLWNMSLGFSLLPLLATILDSPFNIFDTNLRIILLNCKKWRCNYYD